jgi:peptidoglycan/LPS O-acetylase OafA/YrhL
VDPRSRIRRLDGIRGAAVLLVVVYHASYLTAGWGPRLLPGGFVGVDLFFVLSGLLITRLLLRELDDTERIGFGAFMGRRLRRLYPALTGMTAAVVVLLVATDRVGAGADQLTAGELAQAAGATLLYVSNLVQARGWPFPGELSHTWSLAIEAQFYLLWPLVLLAFRALRLPRGAQVGALVAAMVAVAVHRSVLWTDQAHYLPLYLRTDTRIDVVLAGCLLGMLVHWGWWRTARWLRLPALAGVAVLLLAGLLSETGDVRMYRDFGLSAVALAALAVVASALLDPGGPVGRLAGWRPLAVLGDRSYSLYLWHVPVFLTVARHIGDRPVALRVASGLLVTAVLTEGSYRLVESRFRGGGARPERPTVTDRVGGWVDRHRRGALAGAVLVGAAPLVVAVVALGRVAWYPIGDLAQAMLRQLSFWSDPPLVGPAGRIGTFARQGNHPGPAMFWLTWPLWWVLGRSSWAYQASVAALVVGAYATAVVVGRRVQGWLVGLAVAVVGAVLLRSYGAVALTQPWNPYVPLLPFLVFVVACWAVACRRWAYLPLAVAAGSFCVQCHVGYAPAAVVGLVVASGLALLPEGLVPGSAPARGDGPAVPARRVLGWIGASAALGVVLWIPPVLDQIRHEPGNLSILLQTYRDQTGEVIGLRAGTRIWLTQLDPLGNWLFGTRRISASVVPGVVLLAGWAGSAVMAWRRRVGALLRLDLVLAGLLACAWFWAVRLDSARFLYLVEWFWVLTGLLVLAVGWAAGLEVAARRPTLASPAVATTALLAVLAASTASFTWTAVGVQPPDMRYSRTVGALAPPVAAALDPSATYLMTWVDPDALGGNGFGLFLELERRGFRVGAGPARSAPVEPHRVLGPGEADAVVTVVSGDAKIEQARRLPGARELAFDDHRTEAERAEYLTLQAEVMAELRAQGLGDVADGIPTSIWIGLNDPRVVGAPFDKLSRMLTIGQATAVFVSDQELMGL